MRETFDKEALMFYGGRASRGTAREDWTAVYIGMEGDTVHLWAVLEHSPDEDDAEALNDIHGGIWSDLYPHQSAVSGFTTSEPHKPDGVEYYRCWP